MSFLETTSASQRAGAVIGLIVIGLAVRIVMAGGVERYFDPMAVVEDELVAALEEHPGDLLVLDAMRTYFPDDYEDLIETMADVAVEGAPSELIADAGNAQLALFLSRHKNDFANAPTANLDAALASEIALMEALQQQDVGACSAYAFGIGLFEGKPSEEVRELLGQSVVAKVQAMSAGRTDQQMRLEVTGPMMEELVATMQANGASEAQVTVALQGSADFVMADSQRCDAALITLRSIQQQEEYARAMMIGEYLAVG
ncbi:hypothetical protein OZN62_06090 [Aurantiacibacter sp. MUD11]|uniref:hypothetical protein n=1 Tax=Aurantiacibacter sp. MUD11 TaxID=3003265 RepID=UPI0022AA2E50|nr:hypothetical protein [Aurantiacibacter sp. MUD11]WAT19134.1 hypothetical protein OZN62_06090 [Aurantiacibacter sp. MUD11]